MSLLRFPPHFVSYRVPLVFGSLAFAFEGIGLILPIESTLAENQRAGFPRVLGIGMTTVAIIFLITGDPVKANVVTVTY